MTHSAKDHLLAVIKAGISAIPVVGGPIASLIGDYVLTSTQVAVEHATKILGEKVDELHGRLDIDAVNKENFSELFKSCYLVIVRTNRDEKLHAAAAILANILLRPGDPAKSSYEELDHLIRCVDTLSIGAISVLGAARRIAMTAGQGAQHSFQFAQLRNAFQSLDAPLIMSLVSELRALNLLRVQEGAIRTPDYGEVLIEVTSIGERLVDRFIEGKM